MRKFVDEVWKDISEEAKDLIKKMLVKESSRLSAKQVLEHPWFKKDESLISLVNISSRTLNRMKDFSKIIRLKRAILMY